MSDDISVITINLKLLTDERADLVHRAYHQLNELYSKAAHRFEFRDIAALVRAHDKLSADAEIHPPESNTISVFLWLMAAQMAEDVKKEIAEESSVNDEVERLRSELSIKDVENKALQAEVDQLRDKQ